MLLSAFLRGQPPLSQQSHWRRASDLTSRCRKSLSLSLSHAGILITFYIQKNSSVPRFPSYIQLRLKGLLVSEACQSRAASPPRAKRGQTMSSLPWICTAKTSQPRCSLRSASSGSCSSGLYCYRGRSRIPCSVFCGAPRSSVPEAEKERHGSERSRERGKEGKRERGREKGKEGRPASAKRGRKVGRGADRRVIGMIQDICALVVLFDVHR